MPCLSGYGRDHHQSGFKRWGLEMQDDITDGALHLVKEGIVDKNRMGLHGASYGGYASLQGMVKEPDLFKAANSYVAVTDLPTLINYAGSDTSRFSDYLETSARRHIGDPKADADQFEKTSPARNAHKIKGRINLSMGSEDIRVPLIHGDLMVAAMEKAGVKFDYKVYKEEAHGFNKPVNVNDFYSRAIQLFDETIGPKSLAPKDK
jgi:dipeptidyl aminopeptidase/acylaminoacyl peptidase